MDNTFYTSTDGQEFDSVSSIVENVADNYFVSFTPDRKKKSKFRKSCHKEYIALQGIQKSFSEEKDISNLEIIHHLEDSQDDGDFTISIGKNNISNELKVNPNALKTGFFDVEFFRMGDRKKSGLTKSIDDNVKFFFFALPTFDEQEHKQEFREYSNKFYYCKSVDLWEYIIDKQNRKKMPIRMNWDEWNPACLINVPIYAKIFKSLPLHWDEFGNSKELEIFKVIF